MFVRMENKHICGDYLLSYVLPTWGSGNVCLCWSGYCIVIFRSDVATTWATHRIVCDDLEIGLSSLGLMSLQHGGLTSFFVMIWKLHCHLQVVCSSKRASESGVCDDVEIGLASPCLTWCQHGGLVCCFVRIWKLDCHLQVSCNATMRVWYVCFWASANWIVI